MPDKQNPQSQGPRDAGYNVQRLDDVRERVAALEKSSEYYATKEDVANAKVWLITTWAGIGVAVLIGAGNILVMLLR